MANSNSTADKNDDRKGDTNDAYAEALRCDGVAARLRTPNLGHEYKMWKEEFAPALGWILDQLAL